MDVRYAFLSSVGGHAPALRQRPLHPYRLRWKTDDDGAYRLELYDVQFSLFRRAVPLWETLRLLREAEGSNLKWPSEQGEGGGAV